MKDDYSKILEIFVGMVTFKEQHNRFSKIFALTEDDRLKSLLVPLIKQFRELLPRVVAQKKLNETIILNAERVPYKAVFDYCIECQKLKIPQWQILAEKAGWCPPNKI